MLVKMLITIVKWTILSLALLLLAGFTYEQYSRWSLEKNLYHGKTFADVNGDRIHYVKKGSGPYTVVFVSGLGSNSFIWKEIQDNISPYAVTIAYDRIGLFLSQPGKDSLTNASVTAELTTLLEKTNCPKPYILVGHSMAGIYLRPFIQQHEKDIAGIVFVDSSHPLMVKKMPPALFESLTAEPAWQVSLSVALGWYRLKHIWEPIATDIPVTHPVHIHARNYFYKSCKTTLMEGLSDLNNMEDGERYTSFGNIPLTLIMGTGTIRYAGMSDEAAAQYRVLWEDLQHDLLKLSTNSRLIKADKSGHVIQVTEPNVIIDAVRQTIAAVQ
ncbi:alpha/beta fold hydrolase [Chitinophaga nivalis]|uniref:Alpha/beta hydrolase n=1 Tax=Chitinophaga nivalis TaxID=2991709 RepID=A0ABT3IPD7_9BACT|nr:alpha/beta hydrolase [Chitinophaga nivalis]MCW3464511.1 alpha/beta hydrolase [Chitinophaga nivalis]MCW3485798.1 alpha/beta hydrolase [Chitinophaga nivalis]